MRRSILEWLLAGAPAFRGELTLGRVAGQPGQPGKDISLTHRNGAVRLAQPTPGPKD